MRPSDAAGKNAVLAEEAAVAFALHWSIGLLTGRVAKSNSLRPVGFVVVGLCILHLVWAVKQVWDAPFQTPGQVGAFM